MRILKHALIMGEKGPISTAVETSADASSVIAVARSASKTRASPDTTGLNQPDWRS